MEPRTRHAAFSVANTATPEVIQHAKNLAREAIEQSLILVGQTIDTLVTDEHPGRSGTITHTMTATGKAP